MVKAADRVIDLGPEDGVDGGELLAQGTLEEVAVDGPAAVEQRQREKGERVDEFVQRRRA